MFKKDNSFYHNPYFFERIFTVFVKGDRLVIYPFLALLALIAIIKLDFAIILLLVFLILRYFIEVIYWLLQQFKGGKYRPYDYGLKNLSTNSIYIIYQLTSTVTASLFLAILIYFLCQLD